MGKLGKGLVALILIICVALPSAAQAHYDTAGTSDEASDPGPNIQIYRDPYTNFNGQFYTARMAWNEANESVKFRMVYEISEAEMYVYGTHAGCDGPSIGEHHNYRPGLDYLWVDLDCRGLRRQAILLHELGHALNARHHGCLDLSSVMNRCGLVFRLTSHDRALY